MRLMILVAMTLGLLGVASSAWACGGPPVKAKDTVSAPAPAPDGDKAPVKKPGA